MSLKMTFMKITVVGNMNFVVVFSNIPLFLRKASPMCSSCTKHEIGFSPGELSSL
jgi:hypothetical protein